MNTVPKKFLRIHELTFILPDDFNGTVEDAMDLMLEYRTTHKYNAEYVDPHGLFSTMSCLVNAPDAKFCADETIFELKNGTYHIMDSSNPALVAKNDLADIKEEFTSQE